MNDAVASIEYRLMTERDEAQVKELLYESFFKEEPMGKALKMDKSDSEVYVEAMVPECAKQGVSVVASCKTTGKIVGCRLSTLDTPRHHYTIPTDPANPRHEKFCTIAKLLTKLNSGVDIFTKYNVDKFLHFQALNVKLSYSGKGIAKVLVDKSMNLARSKDIHLVVAEVSGKFSQRVYEKLDFDKLNEIAYDQYLNSNGDIIFSNMGVHTSSRLVAKYID